MKSLPCTFILVGWENGCQRFARDSVNLRQPQNVRVILYYQHKFKPSSKRVADWIEHKHPTLYRGKNAVDKTILDDAEEYFREHNVLIVCGGDKGYRKQLGRFSTIQLIENGNERRLWQVLMELQSYFPPSATEILNKELLLKEELKKELSEEEVPLKEYPKIDKELLEIEGLDKEPPKKDMSGWNSAKSTLILVDSENKCQSFATDTEHLPQPENIKVILFYVEGLHHPKRAASWIKHKHPTKFSGKDAVDKTIVDYVKNHYTQEHNILVVCGGDKGYKKKWLSRFPAVKLRDLDDKPRLENVLKELPDLFPNENEDYSQTDTVCGSHKMEASLLVGGAVLAGLGWGLFDYYERKERKKREERERREREERERQQRMTACLFVVWFVCILFLGYYNYTDES
ncbi:hypothetical protein QOT17_004571 [Balamuthia mandrillaris]